MTARLVPLVLLLSFALSGRALARPAASDGCGAKQIAKGDRQERTVEVGGVTRSFILDVPESLVPSRRVPLLLDFHGFGHSAAGVWRVSGFRELAVRERFITAYPQGLEVRLLGREDAGWDIMTSGGNRDVAFVRRLLDVIEGEYCIDRTRVFATGFSNGAFLSHLLACDLADRIAAIAPVSGGVPSLPCRPSRPVPVLIHHGSRDPIVPVDRGRQLYQRWLELDGCAAERRPSDGEACERGADCRDGASVVYCEFDGQHRWPPEATQRIWKFFAAHPMSAP